MNLVRLRTKLVRERAWARDTSARTSVHAHLVSLPTRAHGAERRRSPPGHCAWSVR
jgi:hypothetical protein